MLLEGPYVRPRKCKASAGGSPNSKGTGLGALGMGWLCPACMPKRCSRAGAPWLLACTGMRTRGEAVCTYIPISSLRHRCRQGQECSKLHSLEKDKMLKAGSIPGSVGCCCIGGCPAGAWAARQISEVARAGGHWCRRGGQATAASSAPEHHTPPLVSLLHQHICLSSLSERLNADSKAGRAGVHRSRGWQRRRLVRRGLQYAGCCLGLVAMPGCLAGRRRC